MSKEIWKRTTDKRFQKEWDLFKDDYSTENYDLDNIFEIYLPFWQVKQNIFIEKEVEDDRFTKILLQLIDGKINSRSEICSFLGIEKDNFCTLQLDFLVKYGLVKEVGEEDYEITHKGLSFLENKTAKLTMMEQREFEFMMPEKSTYLKDDLTEKFFDPTRPYDEQLSAEKKSSFLGYKVLETHRIKEKLEKSNKIKHKNKPTYGKLVENRNNFSEFYNKSHENETFYDFADNEIDCHQRNICFLAFLYINKDDADDVKVVLRQSKDSVNEFKEQEREHTLSKLVTEYALKNVEFVYEKSADEQIYNPHYSKTEKPKQSEIEKHLVDEMKSEIVKNRISVYIDAENVINAFHNIAGNTRNNRIKITEIMWNNIVQHIIKNGELQDILYYTSEMSREENESTYFRQKEYLNNIKKMIPKIEIKLGKMRKIDGKYVQKGIDVMISNDMLSDANNDKFDIAFLFSADSDFEDSIKKLKDLGKKVHLITFHRIDSKESDNLVDCCDFHTSFDYDDCVRNRFINRFP